MSHNNHPRRLITHHKPLKKGIKKNQILLFPFLFYCFDSYLLLLLSARIERRKKDYIFMCHNLLFFLTSPIMDFFFVHSGLMLKIGISKFMHPQCVQVNYINGDLLENYIDNPSNHQVHPMLSIKFITIYFFAILIAASYRCTESG